MRRRGLALVPAPRTVPPLVRRLAVDLATRAADERRVHAVLQLGTSLLLEHPEDERLAGKVFNLIQATDGLPPRAAMKNGFVILCGAPSAVLSVLLDRLPPSKQSSSLLFWSPLGFRDTSKATFLLEMHNWIIEPVKLTELYVEAKEDHDFIVAFGSELAMQDAESLRHYQ